WLNSPSTLASGGRAGRCRRPQQAAFHKAAASISIWCANSNPVNIACIRARKIPRPGSAAISEPFPPWKKPSNTSAKFNTLRNTETPRAQRGNSYAHSIVCKKEINSEKVIAETVGEDCRH
ncbi:MAG: hypothetical protein WA414_18915, partial [Acidobacteriaceae bacterium]